MPKVAWIMGSDSDYAKLSKGISRLKGAGIEVDVRVMSAHRTPEDAARFASAAEKDGYELLIAAAGMAAHLGGVIAAHTVLPVVAVPINASGLGGLDALLATVQMPPGIPVATVGIDAAENAAILAIQILSLKHAQLRTYLHAYKDNMADNVRKKDAALRERIQAETPGT